MVSERRHAGPILALALASTLLVGGASAYRAHQSAVDAVRIEAATLARMLSARLTAPVLAGREADAAHVLAEGAHMSGLITAQVTGLDEQVFARWSRGSASAQATVERSGGSLVRVSQPLLAERRPVGTLTLSAETASAWRSLEHAVVPGLLVFACVMLGGFLRLSARSGAAAQPPPQPVIIRERRTRERRATADSQGALRAELAERDAEIERLRRSLDALTEAKTRFLANMSHEIRTPLNGVLGMTELLLNTAVDARQRRFTQSVRRSAESLLNIVNDILDFSRMEAGKLRLEALDFDMVALVEDVVHLHAQSAQAKGLELACQIEPELPAAAHGDPGRLRQVLTNLIGNAIKFTAEGEVVVKVGTAAVGTGSVGYILEVSDTGIGMDRELQHRIFASFFQVDASTTRRFDGAGLGLAISRHLVELMGGRIDVDSEPGKGACFTVTVTLERAHATADAERLDGQDGLSGLRALVVDDNETNRSILAEQLASWQVKGASCADGPSALKALRSAAESGFPFDVAILDMQMPGMDGIALARTIKADGLVADVKIMLLTSAALDVDDDELKAAGIELSTSKPARRTQLYDCLIALAGRACASRPAPAEVEVPRMLSKASVLLVEDNPVNQEVARTMLEALGCEVRVVDDGKAALEACTEAAYDVIFMDCQMPVMDGFAATAALKDGTGLDPATSSTPIIALTANALAGDRERCLAAGMDDYLSKPFKQAELRTALEQWIGRDSDTGPAPAEPRRAPTVVDDPPSVQIDENALDVLRQLQRPGRPDVLGKVVRLFTERSPSLIESMHEALAANECAALQAAAHTLKSSSGNLGATDMVVICKQLEEIARNATFEGVPELLTRLDDVFASTIIELERLCPPPGPMAQAGG